MNFLSVCAGIDAASVAWEPLGWEPVAVSEIEKFPSEVLAHHYPNTPNWGDMEAFHDWPDANVDLLIGGTPCQSFSVAGLRAGLDDPRGNLALTYLAIAERYRPEWVVWENVPGVLSSNAGRDFGAFLGGLGQLGYGFAYRVLDAQHVRVDGYQRAVPQRRRRVFVVGCLGKWRRAAAVLFDAQSLRGDSAPRRQAREKTAASSACNLESDRGSGRVAAGVNGPSNQDSSDQHPDRSRREKQYVAAAHETGQGWWKECNHAGALRCEGENRPSRPSHIIAESAVCPTLRAGGNSTGGDRPPGTDVDTSDSLIPSVAATVLSGVPNGGAGHGARSGHAKDANLVMAVRRLTPTECERLQGFPDGYTAIPRKGKTAADGPRYKALGNSMAVNVIRWIGRRIELVNEIRNQEKT